jgi:hypothetical protein
MNLTHCNLADICGITGVTATKALAELSRLGLLEKAGEMDLWPPRTASLPLSIQTMEIRTP